MSRAFEFTTSGIKWFTTDEIRAKGQPTWRMDDDYGGAMIHCPCGVTTDDGDGFYLSYDEGAKTCICGREYTVELVTQVHCDYAEVHEE